MFAHPFIHTRERMDSSSEQDEEEFFETLEDVASSSDAESGGEEGHRLNKYESSISSASNAPSFSLSRYDVWKNSPGSILERRQRLFTQMGLKVEGEDSENSVVLVDAIPTGPSTAAQPLTDHNVEHLDQGHRNVDRGDRGVSIREGVYAPSASAGWTMVRSRSDGTFSSRLQDEENLENSRLVRSGTTTPVFHQGNQERLIDTSGAVLRTASAPNHLLSKPPLGGKRGHANSTSTSAEGLAARRLQFQWSKFRRFRVTDKNGNSLFDSTGSQGKATNKTSAEELETLRLPLANMGGTMKTADGDVLCRIKDLDSGKEFVVNEVGKDGMWNKLKELDTGREITLEEFESSLGLSPIVQEVMRRERAAGDSYEDDIQVDAGAGSQKRKQSWFKALMGVVKGSREKGDHLLHGSGSDDRDASTEKSGRKSGSATDDSQDASPVSRPVKVHTHKKAAKEFADLHLRQEIQAHQGAIWTMKFSLDGAYVATAGQDKVVRVWEVLLHNSRSNESPNSSGELNLGGVEKPIEDSLLQSHCHVKKSSKSMSGRKTVTSRLPVLFTLSENAKCAFKGHTEDILDLSWSPSQSLLSSSMDKTVRLWNVSSKVCLRIFAHNDYVTCIQFHPLDAGHFISGSLDGKVRIWNVQDPQVVDWVDLQEMVTAACYTPNGQGAVVGSYKGTCRFYKTSGNKLQLDTTFEVRSNKAKRSQGKKITGFQFVPGDKQKLLITSSDSRIRIYDGTEISSKFKGFRNTKSHIAASFSTNGRFIICASEDSRVCIWNYDSSRHEYSGQQKRFPGSYEDFSAKHVLVAIPWPGMVSQPARLNPTDAQMFKLPLNLKREGSIPKASMVSGDYSPRSLSSNYFEVESVITQEESCHHRAGPDDTSSSTALEDTNLCMGSVSRGLSTLSDLQDAEFSDVLSSSPSRPDSYRESCCGSTLLSNCVSAQHITSNGFFADSKGSATWPEEKLVSLQKTSLRNAVNYNANSMSNKDVANGEYVNVSAVASAWGLVIVTAGLGGEIRIFQNYSLPVRL